MARILITVLPLTGHLNPALALADALLQEGHEVAWALHVDELDGRVPRNSRVYPLDQGRIRPTEATSQVRGLDSVRLFFEDYAMPLTAQCLLPLEQAVRDFEPDVIAADYQMPAAALVARKLGVPWVSLVTTTASVMQMSPAVHGWVADQYMAVQRSYLPPSLIVDFPDFSPHAVIVFSITALAGEESLRVDVPLNFVGPARGAGRSEVSFPWEWLRADRRHILVSLGTVSRDLDVRFFTAIIGAMESLPQVQAVLVAPPELAARAPDNVLVRDYVPQLALLHQVDGVVCHAGHNTVCEALLCGLPLIVSPIRDDQPVIARRVIDAGAALFLRHGKVTPASARAAIESLLGTPSLAQGARRLQQLLQATSGAMGAARIIGEVAIKAAVTPSLAD